MTLITRRNPEPARNILDLLFDDDVFGRMLGPNDDPGNIAVDISEADNEVVIRANLPGFSKDDIEVQIHNGVLSIKAQHEEETTGERYFRRERRMGALSRRVALPGVIDDHKARAEFQDGVLTLRVPMAETARPKLVEIK